MSDVLIYGWLVFALLVSAHRHLRGERVTSRAPGTWLGIVVQALGFGAMWIYRAKSFFSIPASLLEPNVILSGLETGLGIASVGLAISAIWVLGRNWSVAAEVIEGHRLITSGPYRIVRHPIYTSMFGMLLATGISLGNPFALLLGISLFVLGTHIRVHFEERLLRRHFGPEFERYAAAVPAFIPFFPSGSPRHT